VVGADAARAAAIWAGMNGLPSKIVIWVAVWFWFVDGW
jgi:hypothetical protein